MPYKDKVQQREAQRQHYLNNKVKYAESRKKNREERDVWFREIKSHAVCGQCGCSDQRCLDYHHRNQAEKEFPICEGVKLALSQDRILAEISKCDVLCANCHMKYHTGNKEVYFRDAITKNVAWLKEYKSELSCVDCGLNDSSILSFHHLEDKSESISNMVFGGCSVAKLIEEIKKCEVICCNCHRIRHDGNVWK